MASLDGFYTLFYIYYILLFIHTKVYIALQPSISLHKTGEQHIHTSTKFGIEMAKRYQKVKGHIAKYYGIHLIN